jgi:hypothetical protein
MLYGMLGSAALSFSLTKGSIHHKREATSLCGLVDPARMGIKSVRIERVIFELGVAFSIE